MSKLVTPNDIHSKRFHVHRLVEGYDIEEVDEFLEEVENTMRVLVARLQKYEGSDHEDR